MSKVDQGRMNFNYRHSNYNQSSRDINQQTLSILFDIIIARFTPIPTHEMSHQQQHPLQQLVILELASLLSMFFYLISVSSSNM